MDIRKTLILVPTRHAGRRLRGELARVTAEHGTAVLTGSIVTPEHLIPLPPEAASDELVLTLMARLLMNRHADFTALLPGHDSDWDFSFALGIAAQLQDVRRQLNEAGRTASEMVPIVPEEEKERWQDIAKAEQGLLQHVHRLRRKDPLQSRLDAARQKNTTVPFSRICSLFIPDLSERTAQTLKSLSSVCPVDLHVLAPESEADGFDRWGRPLPDHWESRPLPIPDSSIVTFNQSEDETLALATLATEAEDRKQALALCTPDPVSAQALGRCLEAGGRHLFLPNGIPLSSTAPGQLLTDWLTLLRQDTYASAAAFLRNPDAQDWLAVAAAPCPVTDLLSELDECQNQHLPSTVEELRRFSRESPGTETLTRALDTIHAARSLPLAEFLSTLYDCRQTVASAPEDPLFPDAAQALARLIFQAEDTGRQAGLPAEDMPDLLLALLPQQQIFPKPGSAETRESLGWMEVQWEPAPALILSNLCEGMIPETRVGDAFLPDCLCSAAGIPCNRDLLARDLFLTQTLLASRPEGAVRFLYSRRTASLDPQLPSRILTACPDSDLPDRISLLFDQPARHQSATLTGTPGLMLTPPACAADQIPRTISVTGFKSYLACPFRFYLSSVLNMKTSEDSQRELDVMLFGTLAHQVLDLLKTDPDLADEQKIRSLLLEDLDRRFTRQFGNRPSLVLTVQLESLRQRLGAAAREQATAVQEGWRIIAAEEKAAVDLDGMLLHGRIDRIERHADGRIRILDYKTSASGSEPLKAHYQSGNKKWVDLQLPLYRLMYETLHPETAPVEVGYFNLPKAVAGTGIRLMDFSCKDGDLYESAIASARQVVAGIQSGIFWPPAKVPAKWDDFAALAPNPPCLIHKVPAP